MIIGTRDAATVPTLSAVFKKKKLKDDNISSGNEILLYLNINFYELKFPEFSLTVHTSDFFAGYTHTFSVSAI